MKEDRTSSPANWKGFLQRLARDTAGNTLMIIAASIAPLVAMVGGGVDLGRSYLAQARLQQACDAGVLAARKRLGSQAVVTGDIPTDVADTGNRFFNVNFVSGAYGTKNRTFAMTLDTNYAISGHATVDVPTLIMQAFGYNNVPVAVDCQAQINFPNTDVMMVLDVTGSMNQTNPGDSMSKIDELKSTVHSFYDQLQASAAAGTRIRIGFVPYSTNVNVGALLADDWVTNTWTYQSRESIPTGQTVGKQTDTTPLVYVSGTKTTSNVSTYSANLADGVYSCQDKPSDTVTVTTKQIGSSTENWAGPPSGTATVKTYQQTTNGTTYSTVLAGTQCTVVATQMTNYVEAYNAVTHPAYVTTFSWRYKPITMDVSDWRNSSNGCMEERDTYEISDYSNVDLSKALDLDIDRVPDPTDPSTQWRPEYPGVIYGRSKKYDGSGSFTTQQVITTDEYVNPAQLGTAACPPPAMKLTQLTSTQLDNYLASLKAQGSTYHDIGMIWGGRLISPTGLFASENADVSPSSPTSRNLIFLTDGMTEPYDLSYSSYGFEPVDQRRWSPSSPMTLKQTVEARFTYVCNEVKKKNITVWIIGFGTTLNPIMKDCAGPGHYFEAADATELNATFATIVNNMSDLRIQK
ncbi:pilus assembly protein [Tsuneonella mangrovi]|uniref:pilus assembly protein n=1 Tax=Tsuneonella mangrovi TaxID=1982042 RepID=UPI00147127A8|nr:Tad domain-containing protein [Tsuneonella mangrovi]